MGNVNSSFTYDIYIQNPHKYKNTFFYKKGKEYIKKSLRILRCKYKEEKLKSILRNEYRNMDEEHILNIKIKKLLIKINEKENEIFKNVLNMYNLIISNNLLDKLKYHIEEYKYYYFMENNKYIPIKKLINFLDIETIFRKRILYKIDYIRLRI